MKSIYDIDLKSWDGERDVLKDCEGKVTLIINTTGHCGNAPQFGIIEGLYQKYKDLGFTVVAVPTNDFCGNGVTYGEYADGVKDAKHARDYGVNEWNASFDFSEIVVSWHEKLEERKNTPHELYQELLNDDEKRLKQDMTGNFEKFLINKKGERVARITNGVLLEYAYKDGYCESPEVELGKLSKMIEEELAK